MKPSFYAPLVFILFSAIGPMGITQPSPALIDIQAIAGLRSGDIDDDGTKTKFRGGEFLAAAHLSPIPLVPVAFGVAATAQTLRFDYASSTDDATMNGVGLGLDALWWIPLGDLKPYIRTTYFLFGKYLLEVSGVDVKGTYDPKGPHIGAGFHLGLMVFEINYGMLTLEPESIEVSGIKVVGGNDLELTSFSAMIGVELGI